MEIIAFVIFILILFPIWLPILGTILDDKTDLKIRIGFPLHNEDKLTKKEQEENQMAEKFKKLISKRIT